MKRTFIKTAAAGLLALSSLASCAGSDAAVKTDKNSCAKNDCGKTAQVAKNDCSKNNCGKNSCKKSAAKIEKSWWQR